MKGRFLIINIVIMFAACLLFGVYFSFNSSYVNIEGVSAYIGFILGNSLVAFLLVVGLSLITCLVAKLLKKATVDSCVRIMWVSASIVLALCSFTITPESLDFTRCVIIGLLVYLLGCVSYKRTLKIDSGS